MTARTERTFDDAFSGLFGDMVDNSMYMTAADGGGGGAGFDPMSASGRKWLDSLANTMAKTGTSDRILQAVLSSVTGTPGRLVIEIEWTP